MKQPAVLVTDARSRKGLAIVRALGPYMVVYLTSDYRWDLPMWSRYASGFDYCDHNNYQDFARRVLDICLKRGVSAVITPEEKSSYLLAKEQDCFRCHGIHLATAPIESLSVSMDKWRTICAAQHVGIAVPRTEPIDNKHSALTQAERIGYPLVVKARHSYYWTGTTFLSTKSVSYVDNRHSLQSLLQNWPQGTPLPMLQEYIEGYGAGVFLLLGPRENLLAEFAHKRLRDVNPTGSESCLRQSVAIDPHLRDLSLSLLQSIGWTGVAMVEFRISPDTGKAYLMEVNGRLWGSLQLAIDAGVNFPRLMVEAANGQEPHQYSYATNVCLRWLMGDLYRAFYILKGRPPGYTGPFPYRWDALKEIFGAQPPNTHNEVFRAYDPLPTLGEFYEIVCRHTKVPKVLAQRRAQNAHH